MYPCLLVLVCAYVRVCAFAIPPACGVQCQEVQGSNGHSTASHGQHHPSDARQGQGNKRGNECVCRRSACRGLASTSHTAGPPSLLHQLERRAREAYQNDVNAARDAIITRSPWVPALETVEAMRKAFEAEGNAKAACGVAQANKTDSSAVCAPCFWQLSW